MWAQQGIAMTMASARIGTDADAARALEIVESISGYAWAADAAGQFIYVSPNILTYLGATHAGLNSSQMSGEFGWQELIHPEDYGRVAATWRHCLQSGDDYRAEHRLRRVDGAYRWVRNTGRALRDGEGNILGWRGTTIDIDELKQVEAALHARERELSQFIDMVPGHVWRLTAEGEPVFFNKRMIDFIGLDVADVDGPGVSRLEAMIEAVVHPGDVLSVRDRLLRCLVTGESFDSRYRLRRADGEYRWMSSRAEPVRDENGRIVQWYGLCHDIDDQVRREEALRRNEHQLQQLIDAVPVRIWSAAQGGGSLYFNKRYKDYLRSVIADFETIGNPPIETFVRELIHPEDAPGVMRTLGNCFQAGCGAVMRFRWREKEDVYRWAECRVEPRRDEDGTIVQWYGVSIDVDDEVRAQDALRHASDKLATATQAASLAELSASIAHEVNQPLAAIVANSQACQQWLSNDPPNLACAQESAASIIRDVNAAAEVISRIRALFRQTVQRQSCSTLEPVITEVIRLLADVTAKNQVDIETRVDDGLPPIALDRIQIQQVLVNLMRNAVEAMEASAGARVLSIGARGNGDVVQVEVADTGPGIKEPEKIFDAFYTTKDSGMGMGLAISRTIVESHGGRLWVDSKAGSGATFVFTLPFEKAAAV